jgi:hypothetical protein
MLTHIVIGATALVVSGLTLFSGFGLGTILMPSVTIAIADRDRFGAGQRTILKPTQEKE